MAELAELLKAWGWLGSMVLSGLFTFLVWAMRKEFARRDDVSRDVQTLAADLAELDARVDLLENEVKHLPTHSDLKEMRDALSDLSGAVRETAATLRAVDSGVKRLETHLLDKGK